MSVPRRLGIACLVLSLTALAGCIADGGYGYDGDYYGPDVEVEGGWGGWWGPGYYVAPGHDRGGYARGAPRGGRAPPYRPAGGGRGVPSLPHGGAARGGGGGGGGGRGGGGGGRGR